MWKEDRYIEHRNDYLDVFYGEILKRVRAYKVDAIMDNLPKIGGMQPNQRWKIILIPLDGETIQDCKHYLHISLGKFSYHNRPTIYEKRNGGIENSKSINHLLTKELADSYLEMFNKKWEALGRARKVI